MTTDVKNNNWHTKSIEQVVNELNTSLSDGLTTDEVVLRQSIYGKNELTVTGSATWFKVMLHQLMDIMNWIFVILSVNYVTGSMLIAVALVNFGLGFSQEYAAEQTLAALRDLSSPRADVIRDGKEQTIASGDLVPGDLILLKEGDSVAADARLVYISNLETDEALLTGESLPVQKQLLILDKADEPLGDRLNMVYSSTIVSKGRGHAIATATAMETEIGKVALKIDEADTNEQTRIQKSMNKTYILLLALAIISVIVVCASVKFKVDFDVGMYAMTIALSVLPAGLTTVMTLTLVLGGKEMTKHRAIIRRLKCLETLGSLTHIFSDKTGTLTIAKMVVVRFWTPSEGFFYVTPNGLTPEGDVYRTFDKVLDLNDETKDKIERIEKTELNSEEIQRLIQCAALCNMSAINRRQETDPNKLERKITSKHEQGTLAAAIEESIPQDEEDKSDWVASGSPTEVALQVFAHKFGKGKPQLSSDFGWELIQEYQFDSTIKLMSTVWKNRLFGESFVFTKGAAERIIPLCNNLSTKESQDKVMEQVHQLASKGLRVIAMAYRKLEESKLPSTREETEYNLTFCGLTGIYDPPRKESRDAVRDAHRAGISVHMLTGDHEVTATAIAKELNILNEKTMSPEVLRELVMTGQQFDALTEDEIDGLRYLPLVVARCSPETKVKMILASQRRNYISAMTGDGVNDSPSLRIADVGISMGKNGSDVAKQASDMILTDDNFATIIRAIKEGRRIYQNMQRFLLYFWIALVGLWLFLIVALAIRDPENRSISPLSTIQMLFLYFAFTPPAGSLSVQPASKTVMLEPPRPPTESIFNREILLDLVVYAFCLGAISLISFIVPLYVIGDGHGIEGVRCDTEYNPVTCYSFYRARGSLLVTLTIATLVLMIHCRSYREPEWNIRGLKETIRNKSIIGTCVVNIVLLVIFLYIPKVAEDGFRMVAVTWEWGLCIALCFFTVGFGEFYKLLKRRYLKPLEEHTVNEFIQQS
ncbi:calcium ATPase [Backusella circina FSU 941]|nr:calcium ATPase [Backusella circina FSU 941]